MVEQGILRIRRIGGGQKGYAIQVGSQTGLGGLILPKENEPTRPTTQNF